MIRRRKDLTLDFQAGLLCKAYQIVKRQILDIAR